MLPYIAYMDPMGHIIEASKIVSHVPCSYKRLHAFPVVLVALHHVLIRILTMYYCIYLLTQNDLKWVWNHTARCEFQIWGFSPSTAALGPTLPHPSQATAQPGEAKSAKSPGGDQAWIFIVSKPTTMLEIHTWWKTCQGCFFCVWLAFLHDIHTYM